MPRRPWSPLGFLVSSSSLLPYLHSFPTRRSSDLVAHVRVHSMNRVAGRAVFRREHDDREMRPTGARAQFLDRSEEHTSELQSRENLVCRLLLEKKNRIAFKQRLETCRILVPERLP